MLAERAQLVLIVHDRPAIEDVVVNVPLCRLSRAAKPRAAVAIAADRGMQEIAIADLDAVDVGGGLQAFVNTVPEEAVAKAHLAEAARYQELVPAKERALLEVDVG